MNIMHNICVNVFFDPCILSSTPKGQKGKRYNDKAPETCLAPDGPQI